MITAVQEEAALSSVTEEQQVSTPEAAEENDKEMEEGQKSLPLTSAIPGAVQLSSRGEPLTATVSPTTISPSYQITLAMEGLKGRELGAGLRDDFVSGLIRSKAS